MNDRYGYFYTYKGEVVKADNQTELIEGDGIIVTHFQVKSQTSLDRIKANIERDRLLPEYFERDDVNLSWYLTNFSLLGVSLDTRQSEVEEEDPILVDF